MTSTWTSEAKMVSHAVSRPTTGTPAAKRVPDTCGVFKNHVFAYTATSTCFRIASLSLEKMTVEDFIS